MITQIIKSNEIGLLDKAKQIEKKLQQQTLDLLYVTERIILLGIYVCKIPAACITYIVL